MKPFRLAFFLAGAAALTAGLSACLREPDYSTTPEISFNSIQLIRVPPKVRGGVTLDSIRVTINYQDGDGDLGIDDVQGTGVYSRNKPDGTPNKFYNNYFIEPYLLDRATRQYVSLASLGIITQGIFNSGFPRPIKDANKRAAPIKGTLTFALLGQDVGGLIAQPGRALRFEVSIADRALRVSNTIVTDTVRINKR